MLGPQEQEAGKPEDTGHQQIEQHEINLGIDGEALLEGVERASLDDLGARELAADRLTQGAAEKWMVVDNDEPLQRHRRSPNLRHGLPA